MKFQSQAGAEADVMLTALGNYVENIAKGNAAIVLSAGMEVRAAAAPIGPMPQPQSLAATEGDMECSIDLGWDRVKEYFMLNGKHFPVADGSKHVPQFSRVPVDPSLLKPGENTIELLSATEHHGIEIIYPGPALMVRYKTIR